MVPGLVTRTSKKKLRRQSSTDGSIDSNHLSFDQGDGDARPSAAVLPTEESSVYRPVKRRKLGRFDSKFGPDMLTSINRTSTMFEMQTAHLLEKNELKGTEDYASLKAVVDEVSNVIMAIAPSEADSVKQARKQLKTEHEVTIPFPVAAAIEAPDYKLYYARPVDISAIGSCCLGTAVRMDKRKVFDIAVTMPSHLIGPEDLKDDKIFMKRAYYLACLTAGIKATRLPDAKLEYEFLHDNELLPILRIVRDGGSSSKKSSTLGSNYIIQLIPVLARVTISLLDPVTDHDKLHSKHTKNASSIASSDMIHNASIRESFSTVHYNNLLKKWTNDCLSFRHACLLGRVWLQRRDMNGRLSKGGFGNFEWAMIMAVLLDPQKYRNVHQLSSRSSSSQLFKAVLFFLATSDFRKNPILPTVGNFSQSQHTNVPMFLDEMGHFNFLYKMTSWSYNYLRKEAQLSLLSLNSHASDPFEALFEIDMALPTSRFDVLVTLTAQKVTNAASIRALSMSVHNILTKGLGDRVKELMVFIPDHSAWEISALPTSSASLLVALSVDPNQAQKTIEHGPLVEEEDKAKAFREFWGEKAELRRFRDGSIKETLVWTKPKQKNTIIKQIIEYLLPKCQSDGTLRVSAFNGGRYSSLTRPTVSDENPARGEDASMQAAFDDLSRKIVALDGLPLQIRHIRIAKSQSQFHVKGVSGLPSISIILSDVVLEFEGSGRWPDDLRALQSTKCAMLLKTAELLQHIAPELRVDVGHEDLNSSTSNQFFLRVIYPNEIHFHVRIYQDRELVLLQRCLKNGITASPDREEAARALASYKRDFIYQAMHRQSIQNLCGSFPVLKSTIKLVKAWFDSHLLSSHFSQTFTEILTARVFVHPLPWNPPTSADTAFNRVLFFLSSWNWREQPLIVDVSATLAKEDISNISKRFLAWRKLDPAMNRVVLFVATSYDQEGVTWTDHGLPSKVAATRMTSLARSCYQTISSQGLSLECVKLFLSSHTSYDFILHVNMQYLQSPATSLDKVKDLKYRRWSLSQDPSLRGDLLNSKEYLVHEFAQELNLIYRDIFILFYDASQPQFLAGLWNPSLTSRTWRVRLGYSSIVKSPKNQKVSPVSDGESSAVTCAVNKTALLQEIAYLGGDLIRKIETRT